MIDAASLPNPPPTAASDLIPATLQRPGAVRFWVAVLLTGVGAGIGAAALTRLLELVQHPAWRGSPTAILDAAQHASPLRHILVLLGAGLLIGIGQLILKQLSSGNGIDTTAAIWFHAGRMPALRTLGSAVLSVIIVGLGVSLGREGAPKQAGAVFANFFLTKGVCRTSSAGCWSLAGRVLEWERRTEFPWAVRSLHWKSCVESWRSVLSFRPFCVDDCGGSFVVCIAQRAYVRDPGLH